MRPRRLLVIAVVVAVALVEWRRGRAPHRPNVLLVTIDTLRADHVGAYGAVGVETPVMDALARRGVRFDSAHSAVPLTGPAHATLLTGQYPPVHHVRENVTFTLGAEHPTLATRLRDQGWSTAAFVGAYPVAAGFGFGQGFAHFDDRIHPNPGIGQGAERPADEVADAAIAWLAAARGPFFAWVHFYDPHAPYSPPSPYRERFAERPYDGEIAFADAQLGRVLDALRHAGHEEDTVVVVMADHGEGLGEHGEQTHGLLLYESTLHVPLIVAGPGVPSGRAVADAVGAVDVLPTVLALSGVASDAALPGRDLRAAMDGQRLSAPSLYAEALFGRLNCRWASLRGISDGRWKLIQGAVPELYDLEHDPAETHDLSGGDPARVLALRAGLGRTLSAMAPSGDRARAAAVSTEQEERLRSLGYVAGGGGAGALDEPGLPDPRPLVPVFERLESLQSATGPHLAEAVREVAGLLSRDPGSPFAHFVMASVAYRAGALDLAASAFERSLALDPDRPVIRQYYGALLRDAGRLADSERELRLAVAQAAPDDVPTRLNLADTLVRTGKLDEAAALVDPILAAQPNDTAANATMGRLLVARGRAGEAVPHLRRAAEGKDVSATAELVQALLDTGALREAGEAATQGLQRFPGHPWLLSLAGRALAAGGDRAGALALLQRAVAARPRRPEVWRSLAASFAAAGDDTTAARCRAAANAGV